VWAGPDQTELPRSAAASAWRNASDLEYAFEIVAAGRGRSLAQAAIARLPSVRGDLRRRH
jgi:hypothetical protein